MEYDTMNESLRRIFENAEASFKSELKKLSESIKTSQQILAKTLSQLQTDLQAAKKNFSENIPRDLETLAEYGWYIHYDFSFPEIHTIAHLFSNNKKTEADRIMCDKIQSSISTIQHALVHNNPNRIAVLNEAFEAHSKEKFYLSIPVFLSQADGITKELLQVGLFNTAGKKYEPQTKQFVDLLQSEFYRVLLHPLKHKGGLRKHHSETNLIEITRHSILHGENYSYGSLINSCKSISLLYYVDELLRSAVEGK
jgi:hypothetical protein